MSYKNFNTIAMVMISITTLQAAPLPAQNNLLFNEVLQKYVQNGLVDYKNLIKDQRLDIYLDQVSEINPKLLTKKEREVFWINTYNAFTLKIVVDNYPLKSIRDLNEGGLILSNIFKTTVWDRKFIKINNKNYSLNDIEHSILRKEFKDPRIHFAIVCASISCPKLRSEAYDANKINNQLNQQTRKFINDTTKNSFDLKKRMAHLSKIFDWYREDFGGTDLNVLNLIAKYLPENIADDIKTNADKWRITYKNYNWNLNEQK